MEFCSSIRQKNRMFFMMLLLVFSLMSVFMPHGLIETTEKNDPESFITLTSGNNRLLNNLRNTLIKIRIFLLRILKLLQILSSMFVLASIRLALFIKDFSKASINHLFSVLCSYFHGGKYKQNMKHSGLFVLIT